MIILADRYDKEMLNRKCFWWFFVSKTLLCRETFEYTMEAPKSLKQKEGEPTMSYINKGIVSCLLILKLPIKSLTRLIW